MLIKPENLKKFQDIYFKNYKIELNDQEAMIKARRLICLGEFLFAQ